MHSRLTLFLLIVVLAQNCYAQSMAINSTGALSDPSAIFDVSSTNKGMLIPGLTLAQRNALPNLANGLTIWCIDCDEFQVYNGTIWKNMSGAAACISPIPPNVKICNQTWMLKNLDVDKYRNGDPIPKVTDNAAWDALTTGAYCYYNNDSATYAATYGKLYNWYAVTDPRGLAPVGWHVPSDAEWNVLVKCVDPAADTSGVNIQSTIAGVAMKETGTTHWNPPNTGATNSSGFSALPGGFRTNNGTFSYVGFDGVWWSSTMFNTSIAWRRSLNNNDGTIFRYANDDRIGFSVRCLRD